MNIRLLSNSLKQPRNKPLVKHLAPLLPSPRLLVRQKLLLLPVDHVFAREQIRVPGRVPLALLQQLIPEDHAQIQRDAEVTGDEIFVVEIDGALAGLVVDEDVKVLEDGDDDAEDEGEIGAVQAERGRVGHLRLGDALGAAGAHEADVRHEDGDPGQQAKYGDQVDKVGEDDFGVVFDVQEGYAGDQGGESEGVNGDATAIGACKDTGAVTLFGKTVERSCCDVEIGVGGAEDEDEDARVYETR